MHDPGLSLDEVKGALRRDELLFYFQPKVSFINGDITGAEALLRWRHGNALLRPGVFLPVAERSGYIATITSVMFPYLLNEMDVIRRESGKVSMAFNVSAQDLLSDGLARQMDQALNDRLFGGGELELEITETTAVSHEEGISRNVQALVDKGIRFSMDDYGTGYSSLETLDHLPFSALKIDQGFVARMFESAKSATLIKTSIAMAQMLGLNTVIEGVETEQAHAALLHCGGVEGQGYWLSPPLPRDEFIALKRSRRRWSASPVGMLRMAQLGHVWQHKMLMDAAYAFLHHLHGDESTLKAMHMDVSQCVLGSWYYGPGQAFAGYREFDRLERPHRLMHVLCGALCESLKTEAGYATVSTIIDQLTLHSVEVFDSLQRLETRVLLEELH